MLPALCVWLLSLLVVILAVVIPRYFTDGATFQSGICKLYYPTHQFQSGWQFHLAVYLLFQLAPSVCVFYMASELSDDESCFEGKLKAILTISTTAYTLPLLVANTMVWAGQGMASVWPGGAAWMALILCPLYSFIFPILLFNGRRRRQTKERFVRTLSLS